MTRAHDFEGLPFRVTHGHPVPVGRQIAAGLVCAILDGRYAPGEDLPSTRELARALRVHRNTVAAAYRSLCDRGLVRAVGGRAPHVAPVPGAEVHPGAAGLLRELAARALERGVRRAELMEELDRMRLADRSPRLLLIEPRAGLRAVLEAELRARIHARLNAGDWRAACRGADAVPGTVVVARPEIVRRLAAKVPNLPEVFPLGLAGGSAELARSTRVRLPGVIALLSRSAIIRRYGHHLAAGYHAVGLSLATPDPEDPAAVARATRIARLVLSDASCRGMSFETRAPVRELQVVSEEAVRRLRRYLGEQT